jgi:pyridoxamine 5'-phosphate oxidase-like protein
MAIPIPDDMRELLQAPNYVHLSTPSADGARNWVVWAGLEDDHILVRTSDAIAKAKGMRGDPRVALTTRTRSLIGRRPALSAILSRADRPVRVLQRGARAASG